LLAVANENKGLSDHSDTQPEERASGNVLPLRISAVNFCA